MILVYKFEFIFVVVSSNVTSAWHVSSPSPQVANVQCVYYYLSFGFDMRAILEMGWRGGRVRVLRYTTLIFITMKIKTLNAFIRAHRMWERRRISVVVRIYLINYTNSFIRLKLAKVRMRAPRFDQHYSNIYSKKIKYIIWIYIDKNRNRIVFVWRTFNLNAEMLIL